MAALHLIVRATALASCLEAADPADSVLLLQDGVYAAVRLPALANAMYALEPDAVARGLVPRLAEGVTLASDMDFVDLVAAHQPIVTWR